MSTLTLAKTPVDPTLGADDAHVCRSQCDGCHTLENCVEAERRYGDLLLCPSCFLTARAKYGPAPRIRYFED